MTPDGESTTIHYSLAKGRALGPMIGYGCFAAFAIWAAIYVYIKQGVISSYLIGLSACLTYWTYRAFGVWKYGHEFVVNSGVIVGVYGFTKLELGFSDIKGFLIEFAGEGGGVIYLVPHKGARFRLPPVEDTKAEWGRLVDLTRTREASVKLRKHLNREIWLAVAVVVIVFGIDYLITNLLGARP